jgi:hypothetical protein
MLCPNSISLDKISGDSIAYLPTTKKVALIACWWRYSAIGIVFGPGPSSKVKQSVFEGRLLPL